jgi:hypothetical protein
MGDRMCLAAAVGALALVACAGASPAAVVSSSRQVTFTPVAKNLNNPRKLFIAPDGALYVVEAGTGGSDKCFGTGPNAVCVGRSASITRVAGGVQKRIVTGLVSWASAARQAADGPAAVLATGHGYDVLFQDASINAKGRNPLGADGGMAGDLVRLQGGGTGRRVIADLAAFEAKHNPDRGAGPGRRFGAPSIESDPYAFTPYRGGFAVVDASGNDLLWVSPKGRISVLAVFPTRVEKLTKTAAKTIGAPRSMHSIRVRAVPTSVAAGPDGALYVGELTGRPYVRGTARVWRVEPGRKPTVYASGFTNISDLAFAGKDLLVLEISRRGLNDPSSPGALVRLAPNGSRRLLASDGLSYPTGLAVRGNSIYVSNYGIFPGTGAGPHGEVVRFSAESGSS